MSAFDDGLARGRERAEPPASTSQLLEEIVFFVRRFVTLVEVQAIAIALWITHTHAIDAAEATPFLGVMSPEKRSGKTRLLEILELLVRGAWRAVLPSEAVLYRKISKDRPTLLLDEVDAVFGPKAGEHEGIRSLLNAGNRRGARVPRCVGKGEVRLEEFDVFCARAIAGIGKLPDTVADRSIPIALRRRAPGEGGERYRRREVEAEADHLRARISAWAEANIEQLRAARPNFPDSLDDRARDGCEPLLAIADAVGGEWPAKARRALEELCAEKAAEDDSVGVQLLRDCNNVRASRGGDRISSAELARELAAIEEAPWAEFSKGKPLTVRTLARLLKAHGIGSGSIRLEDGSTPKGYYWESFADAWRRYLSSSDPQNATAPQANRVGDSRDPPIRHTGTIVAYLEPHFVNADAACGVVADQAPSQERYAASSCGYHVGEVANPCARCGRPYGAHGVFGVVGD